jgi:hypothetical protein
MFLPARFWILLSVIIMPDLILASREAWVMIFPKIWALKYGSKRDLYPCWITKILLFFLPIQILFFRLELIIRFALKSKFKNLLVKQFPFRFKKIYLRE